MGAARMRRRRISSPIPWNYDTHSSGNTMICVSLPIHVSNFSRAPAFAGISMVRPTTNSRNATLNHSRDAVASSMVNRAAESLFLRLYFVISTSIGSASPRNSRRTRTRRFFVSIDNSVISPIPFNQLLLATRAVNASVASFERRRNVRTSLEAGVSSRWRTFLSDCVSFGRRHRCSHPPHLSPPARTPPLLWRDVYHPASV